MKFTSKIVVALWLALIWTVSAFGQGSASGDLHVIVKDEKGSFVTNATVTAREQAKAFMRSTTQNTDGEYRLVSLPPGLYTVTVEASGFAKAEAQDQSVTVGQMKELPIILRVSGVETVVNVSSEGELVETTRSSTTNTVDQRRIDNLPINGRNYINFAQTDSQVVRDNAPNTGAAPTSGLNFGGQRARSNLVNVDGADATDNSVNGVRSTVSQEAVQEFQIITNGYAAEYGRAAGGVVNIITRSGSNDFHGDVFGYLRNRNFQAVNPFSTEKNPAYTRVQAGAAFGGPIKKDKTYYYFSYEITRRHETGFSSIGQNNFDLVNFDTTQIGMPFGPLQLSTFKWKDYRAKGDARYKLMTLDADEFIRRFLIHVLPDGFHRIRHYGLFANANRANNIALARRLLAVPDPTPSSRASDHAENGRDDKDWNACPCCGGRMIIVEAFEPGCQPRFWPVPSIGLDSS